MELDAAVRAKFDSILTRVKEPQSELSIGELGIVQKFTYHANEKTIIVHLNFRTSAYECPACFAVNEFAISRIERDIKEAMETDFPSWTIQFA